MEINKREPINYEILTALICSLQPEHQISVLREVDNASIIQDKRFLDDLLSQKRS